MRNLSRFFPSQAGARPRPVHVAPDLGSKYLAGRAVLALGAAFSWAPAAGRPRRRFGGKVIYRQLVLCHQRLNLLDYAGDLGCASFDELCFQRFLLCDELFVCGNLKILSLSSLNILLDFTTCTKPICK
jgi:hypothetical protein